MKYVADHISLFSLDDPDFISHFIFNEFFNSEIFKVVLESLLDKDFIMD